MTQAQTPGDMQVAIDDPQFTQREAAAISGVDYKTINNWIEREHVTLIPSRDRRLLGRRLFTVANVVQIKMMAVLSEYFGMSPSDASIIAEMAIEQIEEDQALEIAPKGQDGQFLHRWIMMRKSSATLGREDLGLQWAYREGWEFINVWQDKARGRFVYSRSPGRRDAPLYDFAPPLTRPILLFPAGEIFFATFLKCCDVFNAELGLPDGSASAGAPEF